MTRTLLAILFIAVVAALLPGAAPPRRDPRLIDGDSHDLVLLHPARPWRVRLHLQMGNRSFQADWHAQIALLFRYLDTNGDGVLSMAEAKRAPSREQWLHVGQSLFHDVIPAQSLGIATVWVNRPSPRPGAGAAKSASAKPDLEVASLSALANWRPDR